MTGHCCGKSSLSTPGLLDALRPLPCLRGWQAISSPNPSRDMEYPDRVTRGRWVPL